MNRAQGKALQKKYYGLWTPEEAAGPWRAHSGQILRRYPSACGGGPEAGVLDEATARQFFFNHGDYEAARRPLREI